jgi:GNAT superfamily N-acetyltransferase
VTTLRRSTPADAEPLARAVLEGFETYREFTPPDWEPPPLEAELAHTRTVLADEGAWALLAEANGRLLGQVSFLPADRAARPVDDSALAHFRNLFVDQSCWGSGLARDLHAAAIAAARERGFAQMRLFTPARHGRARRFYEREGWAQLGDEFYEPALAMEIVEYRYALS